MIQATISNINQLFVQNGFQDIFQNHKIIFKYNAIKFQNAIKIPKKDTCRVLFVSHRFKDH